MKRDDVLSVINGMSQKLIIKKHVLKFAGILEEKSREKYNKDKAEYLQTYRKDYYQKNKDKMKSTTAKWYQSHKKERREYARQYRRDNVEYFKQYRSERRQKDIDKVFDSYYNYLQNQTW